MLPRTSIVLLLLMIVAEFPLTLCRHPTLYLHHLIHFIWASLKPLRSIESLHIGVGVHPCAVEVADRVVALCRVGHTRVCELLFRISPCCRRCPRFRTVLRMGAAHHHGHRVSPRSGPELSALDQVVDGAVDLCEKVSIRHPLLVSICFRPANNSKHRSICQPRTIF